MISIILIATFLFAIFAVIFPYVREVYIFLSNKTKLSVTVTVYNLFLAIAVIRSIYS